MKNIFRLVMTLFFTVCVIRTADAVSIQYTVDHDENRWLYNYTIYNDSDLNLDAFKILFDYGSYDSLQVVGSGLGYGWNLYDPVDPYFYDFWGEIVEFPGEIVAMRDPDIEIAWAGLLEFSISFNWLLDGTPGDQVFQPFYYDSQADGNYVSWPLEGGNNYHTSNADGDVAPIPEPQTIMLLGIGIVSLAAYQRRNTARKAGKRRNE